MNEEKNNQKINLSVIIPAYNEEKIISETIEGLKNQLSGLNLVYEIIVINDGSTDKTREILEKIPKIKTVNHSENRGYGATLKTGVKMARADSILIMDADGTYPYESIPELLKYAPDYDMVVGARTGKNVKLPLIRKPAKYVINKLANYLTNVKIPDLNSGLRIIKKSLIEKFFNILPDGFSFTTTITLAALTNGYTIKYVSINYSKRIGKSKIRPIRDTLNFFQLIIRTILYFNPLKIFVPFSIILFLSGVLIFVLSYLFTPKAMDVSTTVFIISAIQMLAVGMMADMISKKR